MTDEQSPDEGPTEGDEQLAADLPEELVARIDAALLAEAENRFLKVARIVGAVMGSISDVPRNVSAAVYALRIAHFMRTGQLESQGDLRRVRFSEVRLPSPPLSTTELEELIAKGSYQTLGRIYGEGQSVTQDYATALSWYRIAAEQGEVWSQFNVGRLYMNGYGVQQDDKEAYFWFSLAAGGSPNQRPFSHWRGEAASKLTAQQQVSKSLHGSQNRLREVSASLLAACVLQYRSSGRPSAVAALARRLLEPLEAVAVVEKSDRACHCRPPQMAAHLRQPWKRKPC